MSSRTPRPGWLFCLTLAVFAVGTDDLLIAGLLPVIAQDLDVGTAAAGQSVTVVPEEKKGANRVHAVVPASPTAWVTSAVLS